jgi:uncharacterized protein YciI
MPTVEYAIVYRPGPAWAAGRLPDQQPLNAHIAYIQGLRADKKLIQDGPWESDGSKVTVVEVATEAEARDIAARDPAVQSRLLLVEIALWSIVFGLESGGCLPVKI